MGNRAVEQPVSLAELDARHDDLLSQLEELEERIQMVLKAHLPQKTAPSPLPFDGAEPFPAAAPLDPAISGAVVTCGDPGAPTC